MDHPALPDLFPDSHTPQSPTPRPDAQDLLQALALGWTPRPRSWILTVLGQLGWRTSQGKTYTQDTLRELIGQLREQGLLSETPRRQGYWALEPALRSQAYLRLLERETPAKLRAALYAADNFSEDRNSWMAAFPNNETALAIVKLELHLGEPPQRIQRFEAFCRWGLDWASLLRRSALEHLDPALFARLHPALQASLAYTGLTELNTFWQAERLPLVAIAERLVTQAGNAVPVELQLVLAEHALLSGRTEQLAAYLQLALRQQQDYEGLEANIGALQAAAQVLQGRWAEAQAGFEQAFKTLKTLSGQRKNLLPETFAWLYPLALLAQQTPKQVELARKFCASEAGKREPDLNSPWGIMFHAAQMRLGDAPRKLGLFRIDSMRGQVRQTDFWHWLMRAWLADDSGHSKPQAKELEAAALLRTELDGCGLHWMVAQLDAALALLQGAPSPPDFFVPGKQESWRVTLAALSALGQQDVSADVGAQTRLIWVVSLDERGGVTAITPLEQKHGARGWNKPKAISLIKLTSNEKLEPWDARVVRTIRKHPYYAREYRIDLAGTIMALVGHPHLEFADAPGVVVELSEGAPQIDVVQQGDTLQVRVMPEMQPEREPLDTRYALSSDESKQAEALSMITVLRDSPQRARVIRLSTAQKRAAQLVGRQLVLPSSAQTELQQALQGLAAHFQVHADEIEAAREVVADARLRAELTPQGEGVALRLVVTPLGLDGPRVTPAAGRARMIAAVKGETLGAQRDLELERRHLDALLDTCPMLEPPRHQASTLEWVLDAPEDALALLEALPPLAAIAGIDWPKGKALQVTPVQPEQLHVQVHSARDWFGLQGGVRVDERTVLTLQQLLDWSREGKGRFVPLGEGRYLALTNELRARIEELATVAERHKDEARIPQLAAPWLEQVLDGMTLATDAAFRERLERLSAAQATAAALPGGLQAQLRPYQEEGYQWAQRLATAGFGACLADDMGLGKTLQALALLLARAPGGPALVVTPTSLGGNWLAEAQRFAPALNVTLYGDGTDRGELLQQAGAQDVVVVSYTLLQQAAEEFSARRWHTLVVDEAQAIKNASAKRSQAVFELEAEFRLALSGTPIENRLAELWSIMRFCNPGLLGSSARFNQRFAVPIERERNREAQRTLRRLIAPFILRRTKAQVLEELPPRIELQLSVTPDAAETAHYEALRRQAVAEAEQSLADSNSGQARMNVLAQLTRLRRAACDPRLTSPELGLVGAKVQAFAELAAELAANQHKTLVFSQFVDFLNLLRAPLDAAGISYQYLDGSTPAAERSRRVAAFQAGEGELFLISLKAGGFGLNLTAADYVVIADPWWNPAAEDQAMGRAHRMGQQRPVTVYRLVNQGTLEERIVALHHDKRALAEGILDGAEGVALPSTEDLIGLIRGE
jgi:superfamily II DNA or RNA helicase